MSSPSTAAGSAEAAASSSTAPSSDAAPVVAVSATPPAVAAIRHDWYQTDDKVVVTVLLKNATAANCAVQIQAEHVHITAANSATGLDYTLDLQLLHRIDADRSTYRIGNVKVEINLFKVVGERWATLTRPLTDDAEPAVPAKVVNIYKQDWEKLEKHVENNEDEYREGDALNSLFQKIYKGASEETRRAMNKSFSESGGTVLSTNWDEIGQKKVEVKPPDGTEFKTWD